MAGDSLRMIRKVGILMINMGGPRSLKEVNSYLNKIFSDTDIMKLPFQNYSGKLLARMRTPKVQEHYKEIGGKSPIHYWTNIQGEKMVNILNKSNDSNSLKLGTNNYFNYYVGFRYATPSTEEAIDTMARDGVKRIIVFSQYPQYSCSTTGSSLNSIYRYCSQLSNIDKDIKWSVIDRWHMHPGLINAFVENIEIELNKFPKEKRKDIIILFSAHSLPMSVVKRGDPYQHEVAATVNLVMKQLNWSHSHRLVWQSKVGPVDWLSPSTKDVIKSLIKKGHKNILLVPIAFTSDHIETLHEMDIEYMQELIEEFKTSDVSNEEITIKRCASLNDSPLFIQALAEIVTEHLTRDEPYSAQMRLTCPFCINPVCQEMRKYFDWRNQN